MDPNLTPSEVRAVIVGTLLALFLSALDQTIIATALPQIARDIGDFSLISWVVTAYLLTSTCATSIVGKLSDFHGRRPLLIACVGVFMLGSALCALAEGMTTLILARALQGLGGGGLITLVQAIFGDVAAPRERGRYSAYFSAVYASASVLGPSLGGLLTQYCGWPSIFWINLPLGLIALATADRALRKLEVHHHRPPIDYVGIVVLCGTIVAFLMAISLGGKKLPWTAPEILGLGGAALILGSLFIRLQKRSADPVLPGRFITDSVLAPLLASNFVIYGSFLAISVLAPVYFQVALGTSVSEAGFLTIPVLVSTSITATFGGRYSRRRGRYKLPPLIGLPFAVAALMILAIVADEATPPVAAAVLMVAGMGVGPVFPSSSVAALNAVEPRDFGAAAGALSFVRALGSAIAVAAASALVLGLASRALPDIGHAASLEDLVRTALPPEARAVVARAFGGMFGVSAGALLLGLLTFACVEDRQLRDKDAVATAATLE
jgi:EmrB/QacA subfamily drug resistance transporter